MPIRVAKTQKHSSGSTDVLPNFKPEVLCETLTKGAARRITDYQLQVDNCAACPLGSDPRVKHRPTWRGSLPCEILFVGEAPGDLENKFGYPFLGEAGRCLEQIVNEALKSVNEKRKTPVRVAYTNTVQCMPFNDKADTVKQNRQPLAREARPCVTNNLDIFIRTIAKPSIVVFVGRIAEQYVLKYPDTVYGYIVHPSYILSKSPDPRGDKLKSYATIVDLADQKGLVFG